MAKLPSPESLSGSRPSVLVGGGVTAAQPVPVQRQAGEYISQSLGNSAEALAGLQEKDRQRDDALKATLAINDLQNERIKLTADERDGFRNVKGANADQGTIDGYLGRFNDAAQKVRSRLTNEDQRRRFDMEQGSVRLGFQSDLYGHVAKQREVAEDDAMKATLETEKRAAAASGNDPLALETSILRVEAKLGDYGDKRGLSQQRISELQADARSSMYVAALNAQRLTDPVGALATYQKVGDQVNIEQRVKVEESLYADAAPVLAAQILQQDKIATVAGTESEARAITELGAAMNRPISVTVDKEGRGFDSPFDRLPSDQKLKVLHLAKTQADQGLTQVRQGLTIRVQDATAALERGQAAPDAPTSTELVSAFGQERGAQLSRGLDAARTFGDAYVRVAGASREEQVAILTKMKPDENAPGYAESVRRYEQLAGVIDRVRKEQDQDPAGFVLQQSPAKQRVLKGLDTPDARSTYELFQTVQNDPRAAPEDKATAARSYAAATLAEQRRLGVQNPTILPKADVDSIVKRFNQPPAQGENQASVMRGLVDQWGPYWPAVGKQLKGRLPPEIEVMGLGVTPEAEQLLTETAKLKHEQLRQGLQAGDVKDIQERVRSVMEPLQRTVTWQGGGLETYDNYADSAEKIATALVQKGMKPKDAAQKAFDSLVGFKYEFEGTWRVPKSELGGEVNVGMLRLGAEALKRDITADKPVLGDKVGLTVPVTGPGVRPQDADRQWRDTIAANGFWVTSPGDGGLTLYVKSGLSAQPVLDDKGQPVRRTWDQISGIGRSTRAATFSDVYDTAGRRKP